MQLHLDNNVRSQNEIRNFFKGPIYLLLLKLPLAVLAIIVYIIYGIVKVTIKQLINVFAAIVIYTAYLLVDGIGYYLVLICKNIPAYIRCFGSKFYRNVLQPIKFFTHNSIIPVIYDVSEWILDTIVWFGIWCYQQIILPVVRFCYLRVIAPIPTWINKLSIALCTNLRLLLRRFRSASIWTWEHILYPLCQFIFIDVPLAFYHNVSKIWSLIYTWLITPLYRLVKYIVPIMYYYLRRLFHHVSTCTVYIVDFFYEYGLLAFYHDVFWIGSLIYTGLIIPLKRLVKHIVPIMYYYLRRLFHHLSTCVVCTVGSFCDTCAFFYEYGLLAFYHNVFRIGSLIYTRLLIPLNRLVQCIVPIMYYYLRRLFHHASTCTVYIVDFFYEYGLLAFYHNVFWIGSLIYTGLITPLNRLVKYIVSVMHYYLQRLFHHLSTCLVCTVGSFCDACAFFYEYGLLAFYHNVFWIGSLVYTGLLIPLNRLVKYIVPIIYYYLGRLFLYVSTCASVYRYVPWHLCQTILTICTFIYHELLKSVSRSVLLARIICDRLYQFIFHPIGCALYSTGQSCYEDLLHLWRSTVYKLLPATVKISSEILLMLRFGLDAAVLAIGKLGRTVGSVFRTNTHI